MKEVILFLLKNEINFANSTGAGFLLFDIFNVQQKAKWQFFYHGSGLQIPNSISFLEPIHNQRLYSDIVQCFWASDNF
jgi:hypothetical protein